MPIDPSIPLAIQTPQIDYGALVGRALELRQLKDQIATQNVLKQVLAEPGAIDPKTGEPTDNALAKIMRVSPAMGMKMVETRANAEEKAAQTEHARSQTQTEQQKAYRDKLSEALGVYDADLKSGNIDPATAERNLKQTLHDQLYGDASLSPQQRDRNWALVEKMNPAQLRALTISADQKEKIDEKQREETEERSPATMGGKPVLVDKTGAVFDPNTGEKLKVTAPVEREASGIDPQRMAMEERRLSLQEKIAQGSAADLTEDDLKFAGSLVANGQPMPNMGFGAAGAKARAKILHYAAMEATREAGGSAEQGGSDVVVRKETLAADKSALVQSQKQQQSVRQFSQTALGLADKVEGLMNQVTTKGGPEALAKIVVNIKTKALGDPQTREFLGYIKDLQSENAKIMAGATGSVAQVSAHNQEMMNEILTGAMPASEIPGALRSIREGIRMRNEAVDDEVKRQRTQMKADTAGGGGEAAKDLSGEIAHPKSKADYDALPSGAHYTKPGDPPGSYRVKP